MTERRLSGRRAGVAGGESWLKALAIMRVAAEEQNKRLLQSYFLSLYALFCTKEVKDGWDSHFHKTLKE